jgi:hypothetical protein
MPNSALMIYRLRAAARICRAFRANLQSARVLACPLGCGGKQAGARVGISARPSDCGRSAVPAGSTAAPANIRQDIIEMLPMARCCAKLAARCTRALLKLWNANSPKLPSTSLNCWRITAPKLA